MGSFNKNKTNHSNKKHNPKGFKQINAFDKSTPMNQVDKLPAKLKRKFQRKKSGYIDKKRIVVRNLSSEVTEDELKKCFEECGQIKEVNILRWDSGRPKGVAFIQFIKELCAQNAIEKCNMMTFLGQPIAVDLAVPRKLYKKEQHNIENEPEDSSEDEDSPPLLVPIDEPPRKKLAIQSQMKKEKEHRPASADVMEGRTLFLKNISYETTKEEVMEVLNRFSPLDNLFFCKDKSTDKFKGTAFAHFLTKENADKCLEESKDPMNKNDFTFNSRKIDVFRAIPRGEIPKKPQHDKEPLDKRNIYLAREGVIREGTSAAEGVSKSDMMMRIQREVVKRKMLANLSIFVSPIRLFVSNLSPSVTDAELLKLIKKHSSKEATITESKVMRNLHQLDEFGKAVSKGYGFVTFTQHQHAIEALRAVNNNPDIFTPNKRPIVEFSLENREAVMTKFRRMSKSREKNMPPTKIMTPDLECKTTASEQERKPFVGSSSNPNKKGIKALQSHIGPKVRQKAKKLSRNKLNAQLRITMKRNRARTRGGKKAKVLSKKKKEKAKQANLKKKTKKKLTFLS